ncbi:MAG: hemolysin family protein [Spirochaetota bacterium]
MIIEVISIIILIGLSAVFSSTETAFTSLSFIQVKSLVKHHGKAGKLVEKLSNRPDTLLTTILIGNNLVNIAASAIATQFTIKVFGSQVVGITTGVLTLIILIFAEVTPKQMAIIHSEKLALRMAYPIRFFSIVLYPFIKLIGFVSSAITQFFTPEKKVHTSLDGILHMVHLAEREGVVENYETRMVKSVFRFNDTQVQTIMTHRTDIFSLEADLSLNSVLKDITKEGYSRIPVYDDNPEHIVGILLVRDMMRYIAAGDGDTPIREIMTDPIFVSETRRVNELFFLFKKEKLNIAVVMDEYGGLAGIVTLEDVAEELFGELYDENEIQGWEKITHLGDNSFRITGDTSLHQLDDRFNITFEHSKYVQTIGGLLVEQIGTIPVKNQKIETPKGTFVVENIRRKRIESVIFTPFTQEEKDKK